MRTIDAIAHILKQAGVEYLSTFPSTPLIEAAAKIKIRPIVCRQERVGVAIADGYARVKNGRPPGVFAMQVRARGRKRLRRCGYRLLGRRAGAIFADGTT